MSHPTVEAPGLSPAKSRHVNDGFGRVEPGLKPVSYCPFTARLKQAAEKLDFALF